MKFAQMQRFRQVNLRNYSSICRLTKSEYHVDNYGFKHTYENEGLLLHYICQQLHQFYTSQLSSYEEHQKRWKDVLTRAKSTLIKTVRLFQVLTFKLRCIDYVCNLYHPYSMNYLGGKF